MYGAAECGVCICFRKPKKLIKAHQLNERDDVEDSPEDGFLKACALIRANLHVDPTAGSAEDFATNYAAAVWLENWRLKRQAEMIAKLFGDERENRK